MIPSRGGIARLAARAMRELNLTQAEIARLLHVSPRAVSRWVAGASVPQKRTRQQVLDLAYLAERLSAVLRHEDINLWIFSRNALLSNDSPADRIERGDIASVLGVVDALAEGVVA